MHRGVRSRYASDRMSPRGTLNDRMRRLTAAVIVTLYAVLAVIGPAVVVCEDAGGHVAIEWRGADCCIDDGASLPRAETPTGAAIAADSIGTASIAAPPAGDDCGECRDAPMTSLLTSRNAGATQIASVPAPADLPAPAAAVAFVPAWVLGATFRAAPPRVAPTPPPPLAFLRTVVLRC